MKTPWYQEIFNSIDKYLATNLPVQLIYFPSTGITSALNKAGEESRKQHLKKKLFIIDFRATKFDSDPDTNKIEFFRIIKEHIEQQLTNKMPENKEISSYQYFENLFNERIQAGNKVIINLQHILVSEVYKVPQFNDFLLFLDRQREITQGKLNFLITETFPFKFESGNFPVPLITKYFNYYSEERLNETVSNDILPEFGIKFDAKDVEYLIDISGGLVTIIKSLIRDLIILDRELEYLDEVVFDQAFFEKFENVKTALERIIQHAEPQLIQALLAIIEKQTDLIKPEVFSCLIAEGIFDVEKQKIRGEILPAFLHLYVLHKFKKLPVSKVMIEREASNSEDLFYEITPKIKIHHASGEIYFENEADGKYLSEKELEIFLLFFKQPNTFIDRNEVAKLLWGKDLEIRYSDWAIDKTISRIREKLRDERPYSIIKTIRGKGFLMMR
ncbi:MAG: helix-turn-helix domain-containing protein [bacterium]